MPPVLDPGTKQRSDEEIDKDVPGRPAASLSADERALDLVNGQRQRRLEILASSLTARGSARLARSMPSAWRRGWPKGQRRWPIAPSATVPCARRLDQRSTAVRAAASTADPGSAEAGRLGPNGSRLPHDATTYRVMPFTTRALPWGGAYAQALSRSKKVVVGGVVTVAVIAGAATMAVGSITSGAQIPLAPQFTAAQLNAYAGNDWITNGGNAGNDRYSSLTRSPRRTSGRCSRRGRPTSVSVRNTTPRAARRRDADRVRRRHVLPDRRKPGLRS